MATGGSHDWVSAKSKITECFDFSYQADVSSVNCPTKYVCLGVSFARDLEASASDNFVKKLLAL